MPDCKLFGGSLNRWFDAEQTTTAWTPDWESDVNPDYFEVGESRSPDVI
jgi:hypothetical protein